MEIRRLPAPDPPRESNVGGGTLDHSAPPQSAQGSDERWELLGEVSVDGACLMIADPGYISGHVDREDIPRGKHTAPCLGGLGLWFWSGFGDGGYEVWGRIVNYGEAGYPIPDERVAEVRIIMVTDERLAEWRSFQ